MPKDLPHLSSLPPVHVYVNVSGYLLEKYLRNFANRLIIYFLGEKSPELHNASHIHPDPPFVPHTHTHKHAQKYNRGKIAVNVNSVYIRTHESLSRKESEAWSEKKLREFCRLPIFLPAHVHQEPKVTSGLSLLSRPSDAHKVSQTFYFLIPLPEYQFRHRQHDVKHRRASESEYESIGSTFLNWLQANTPKSHWLLEGNSQEKYPALTELFLLHTSLPSVW